MSLKLRLFLLVLITFNSYSQNKTEDSFFKDILEQSKKFHSDENFRKASFYLAEKKWDSTIIFSQKSLENSKRDKSMDDFLFMYRGISLFRNQVYDEAENQFNLISEKFQFINKVEEFIGAINLNLKRYKKAITYYKRLSNIENKTYVDEINILNDLALCHYFLSEFQKAEFYFEQSNKYEKDSINLVDNYINIANLYYQQYKDDIAIPYFQKAYDLSKKLKISDKKLSEDDRKKYYRKQIAAKNMAVIEENRKNYNQALVYRKEYEKYVDTLNNRNKIYAVAKKEKEFAVAAKQKEVDLLQVENKLKETERKIFLYSAIGLLLFLGIGAYFFREKVKTNKIIAAQKETLDELNTTKDKLFSIVSHDLRSSVNALKSSNKILLDNLASKNLEALENLLHKNSTIVNGAYGLLDNLLNWALMQTEQQYFSIEKQRLFIITEHVAYNYKPLLLEKELNFENTVSKKEFVQADQESLKIVLRNLIDNAIKFSQPNGFIKIYSSNTIEGFTNLIVEDSGLGMSDATRLKLLDDSVLLNKKEHEDIIGTGLGIQLVKSMIKKNNGKFDIESELGKGTKMIVSLPKTVLDG
ncbi:Histidine kinase domain-containing protein [Tenacibaculum sp. 190524A05c]|uniref:tetratricopeptide repeat-containing sensor histidine kinase n=1 Tax=Tenacibaculum platacis TaxID=3137852 RepID=UPI0031FB027C